MDFIARCLFDRKKNLLPLAPFFSFFSSIFPWLCFPFFLFSFFSCTPADLEPLTFRTTLAYQSLFYITTLRGSVETYPSKNHFYFTWLVQMHKNLHYNFLIRLLNACFTLHENIHAFIFPYFKPKIPQNFLSLKVCEKNGKISSYSKWKTLTGVPLFWLLFS